MEKNIFSIDIQQLEQILSTGLDLNHLFLLEYIEGGGTISSSPKVVAIFQGLVRKQYATDDWKLTTLGTDLLQLVRNGSKEVKSTIKNKIVNSDGGFEEWWDSFPGTDGFTHKGVKFEKTRGLKQKKPDCQKKFRELVIKGPYTAQQIIQATRADVQARKESSIKKRANQMSFLQNSLTYLNQESYQGFIDSEIVEENNNKLNGVDI